jgi:peptidyl-prolyl cis-trans isomerase SurA
MNRMKLIGIWIFCFITGSGVLLHAASEPLNRVVAIVNNEVITLHELNKKIKEMTGLTPEDIKARSEEVFLETRRQVLDLLIDERITQEKIKELNIKVSQRQVEEAVERIKRENQVTHEDLLSKLKMDGLTYEKYLEKVRKDLERMQLINSEVRSKIIISEDKVKQYYEEHKAEFSAEEKVHLAGIFIARKAPKKEEGADELFKHGEEILAKLRKGADFAELAKKFSEGPGADEGGDLGVFDTAQLEPELRKILEGMKVGGYSDLIVRPNGIQIIKLIKREGGKRKPLEEVREAVYSILYQGEVNERYMSWIRQLRERSYTKITF